MPQAPRRTAAALHGRDAGDRLGRDRRGRARWRCSAHATRTFHGRGPPLRARRDRRSRAGHGDAVRGAARRRAGLAARRRPPAVARSTRATTSARRGSCSARAGSARRSAPPYTLDGERASGGLRGRRAVGLLAAAPGRPRAVARLPAAARRPGVRRRGVAGDARVHPRPPRRRAAARRAGRRLRGVHAAVPRGVERPGHPLAALDRAEHDDLRRPRRPRRLEHLRGLGAATCARSRGGRSASSARSWPTGSTSTSATWRRRSWPRSALVQLRRRRPTTPAPLLREFAHAADRESAASRWRVPPRLRPLAARGRRLARRPRARRRPPRHGRRRGVGLDRRARRAATTTT